MSVTFWFGLAIPFLVLAAALGYSAIQYDTETVSAAFDDVTPWFAHFTVIVLAITFAVIGGYLVWIATLFL